MFNLKPIALVCGTVVCAVGFLLFIPLITEIIYQTDSWQSYAVPILLYLIVGGSLVITNRSIELKISTKEAFVITVLSWFLLAVLCSIPFIFYFNSIFTYLFPTINYFFGIWKGLNFQFNFFLTNLISSTPKGLP